jgi:hypothetical protein
MGPMTTIRMFLVAAFGLLASTVAQAQAAPEGEGGGDAATFLGSDGNWFNPANWSTGEVPGKETPVIIEGDREVRIDPARGESVVEAGDILLRDGGILRLLPGTELHFSEMTLDVGHLKAQSAGLQGEGITIADGDEKGWGYSQSTVMLNPSFAVLLEGGEVSKEGAVATFVLGGAKAASPGNTGKGFYGNLTAGEIALGARLDLRLMQGFVPEPGSTFDIVTATTAITGTFAGLPDGGIAGRYPGGVLVVDYQPRVVRLTAVADGDVAEFTGSDGNWFNPNSWSTGEVPGAGVDVVVGEGRELRIDPSEGTDMVSVGDIFVEHGATLRLLPGARLQFDEIRLNIGRLEAQSAELHGQGLTIADSGEPDVLPGWGYSQSTVMLNPSFAVLLGDGNIVQEGAVARFVLGGGLPAGPGETGNGFYANIAAEEIALGAGLEVELKHDFAPAPGDTFDILTANKITGRFSALEEGDVAARFGDVALTIQYLEGSVRLLAVPAGTVSHSADTTPDGVLQLGELLRIIQLYNAGGFHCMSGTDDGFAVGEEGDTTCEPHDSDYNPQDWKLNLSELLRGIQLYNSAGYRQCPSEDTEDGFCPGNS